MKQTFLLFALLIALTVTAQQGFIFDTSRVDGSTKLIGRYPQFDKDKIHRNLNFIIDNPADIKRIIPTLTLGKEVPNEIEEPGFQIAVIQNKDEIKTWIVNPASGSVLFDGHTYAFDISKIRVLAAKYPFDYRFDKITFKNKPDFDAYLLNASQDSTFLFDYRPRFRYEGSFEIEFPGNKRFSSPKAISEYLKPLIEKIVREKEYSIRYFLSDKNRNNPDQFTMNIEGSKKLYEELQPGNNLKKENWQETVEQGWFFYRTK